MATTSLLDRIPARSGTLDVDALAEAFAAWSSERGEELYEHQTDALIATLLGNNTIITTPTGSGKTLIAVGGHFATLAAHGRSYYTAPIKALVSEKFFALCDIFSPDLVGMITGDARVNPDAPIICCTAEILANIALREGRTADIDLVIMDEFHFVADRDRGWAWQIGMSELPQAQFMIMSATLGDVSELAERLSRNTGRETTIVDNAVRPVPLTYRWALTPITETIDELIDNQQTPCYVVHPSQAAATERAQALLSTIKVSKQQRAKLNEALAGFRFASGFGTTLARMLRGGVGVHHAGMLPKYRRLVETLAQLGLLQVICGTDTLGVGINMPIRSVLFSTLNKFDGRRARILRSREFHQIAGRAGRPGFDTVGYVIAQAPEHEVEHAKAVAKANGDAKKLRSIKKKSAPEGFVNYTEKTFQNLVASTPETLHAHLRITHAMLLNLLRRDEDVVAAVVRIVEAATSDHKEQRRLYRRALELGRSLREAGVVTRRTAPTAGGRTFDLAEDLQDDFALNQPLSDFALAALDLLDPAAPTYALDIVSVIEATLEEPLPVLLAQRRFVRGELVGELKADGYDYEDRQAIVEDTSWPRPLGELLDQSYTTFAATHPWITATPLSPKSIVRDMVERAMTFGEYIAFYKVQRSEGLLLRYLSDAFRALRQTVPEQLRSEEFSDILEWLGQVVRMTDSSLLDEWERMSQPDGAPVGVSEPKPEAKHPLTGNARAFTVLVRNAMFRRVQLAAADDVDGLAALDASGQEWGRRDWDEALGDYWDEHDEIGTDATARSPEFFVVERGAERWEVRQIVSDPAGNHDWSIQAEVDLAASDAAEQLVLRVIGFGRQD